ncbi:MAG: N-6 DNA methylase [Alphaproteobacteria bacterium]|nr:N-6 DNA methylase [Alphaproteobacteria bacterium]
MSRRHGLKEGDWPSVVGRLEELVRAGSGADPFEAILRLVLARLADERAVAEGRAPRFTSAQAPAALQAQLDALLTEATQRWSLPPQGPIDLRDEHLAVCVEAIEGLSLAAGEVEILDAVFEVLVSRAAKGAKGQFFTPRHVVEACVRLVDPKPGERVLDPSCGSGGFLLRAFAHQRAQSPATRGQGLWGVDLDARAVRVARCLLQVSGAAEAQVHRGDSLFRDPDQLAQIAGLGAFDVVLTNPPFAGEVREPALLAGYALAQRRKRVERDLLFLERVVGLLRPGGRLAIVLPHDKLAAKRWGYAREWLLRHLRVVAVLGLARESFQPHTSQKTCVLLGVRRARPLAAPPPDERIRFVVSERAGKDSRGEPILREGAPPEARAWERLDHDLGEAVELLGGVW